MILEGLVFASSHASASLGISVAIALAGHNFTEGITIALPIYIATRSSIKAFLVAVLLGGLSQPLGALVAYLMLGQQVDATNNILYGVIFSVTAGIMSSISIQGMIPVGLKIDAGSGNFTFGFFAGIGIFGLSQVIAEA